MADLPKPWVREANKGDKNVNWKGEKASYRAIHIWVEIWKGKPEYCIKCGVHGTKQKMHWANISGEYKRDLTDWIRLCPKCHGEFDKGRRGKLSKTRF